jgi:hypothetical protein
LFHYHVDACLLFLALAAWVEYRGNKKNFYLRFTALILMIVTLLITVLLEAPIDNDIKTWTVETVPENREKIRHT